MSNGNADSSTLLLVDAAPEAANPLPIHSHKSFPVTSSAEIIITLSARPVVNQSSAQENAAVVEAQARLRVVLGPLIPVYWAN